MGFPLVPKLVTLNGLKRRNGRYFALLPNSVVSEANYNEMAEVRLIQSATKI